MTTYPVSRLRICAAVFLHVASALTTILANKAVLNTAHVPLTLLTSHALVILGVLHLLVFFGWLDHLHRPTRTSMYALGPLLTARFLAQFAKLVCLAHVQAAFYQIVRGLLLPMTIALSVLFLAESRPSVYATVAALVTTGGFLMGVSHEQVGQTSRLGLALGVGSSLLTAIETVISKATLSKNQYSLAQLVHDSALFMVVPSSMLVFWTGEYRTVLQLDLETSIRLGLLLLLASLAACVLSLATFLQIKLTSPTTHMITTAARGVLQSVLAVLLFKNEQLSASRIMSLGVILFGTVCYAAVKESERHAKEGGHLPISRELVVEELEGDVDDSKVRTV